MRTELNSLYDGIQQRAEEKREEKSKQAREDLQRLIEEQNSKKAVIDMGAIGKKLDDNRKADMDREIEEAKARAEAEVRAKYESKFGTAEWNESERSKAWKGTLSGLFGK